MTFRDKQEPVWVIKRAAAQPEYVGEPFQIKEYCRTAGAAEIKGNTLVASI